MILTNTYAVKQSSLRMYKLPEVPVLPCCTFSVTTLSAVWQLTAHGKDLLHPTWARTPLAA